MEFFKSSSRGCYLNKNLRFIWQALEYYYIFFGRGKLWFVIFLI